MAEVDFKKVLCVLIQDGVVTKEQAKWAAKKVEQQEKPKMDSPEWAMAVELTELLHERIAQNGLKPFRRAHASTLSMDRLLRIDKRPADEIRALIEWCQSDDFWSGNILSPMNFRKHYDRMKWQMTRAAHSVPMTSYNVAAEQAEWDREIERRQKESVSKPKGFLRSAMK